jgi:hypothetical protein
MKVGPLLFFSNLLSLVFSLMFSIIFSVLILFLFFFLRYMVFAEKLESTATTPTPTSGGDSLLQKQGLNTFLI